MHPRAMVRMRKELKQTAYVKSILIWSTSPFASRCLQSALSRFPASLAFSSAPSASPFKAKSADASTSARGPAFRILEPCPPRYCLRASLMVVPGLYLDSTDRSSPVFPVKNQVWKKIHYQWWRSSVVLRCRRPCVTATPCPCATPGSPASSAGRGCSTALSRNPYIIVVVAVQVFVRVHFQISFVLGDLLSQKGLGRGVLLLAEGRVGVQFVSSGGGARFVGCRFHTGRLAAFHTARLAAHGGAATSDGPRSCPLSREAARRLRLGFLGTARLDRWGQKYKN